MDQQIPTQRGTKVAVPEVVVAPPPFTADTRPSRMTLRVYAWCPDEGAHTDPELHSAYAEWGI